MGLTMIRHSGREDKIIGKLKMISRKWSRLKDKWETENTEKSVRDKWKYLIYVKLKAQMEKKDRIGQRQYVKR